jgi:hypothetical protein
MILVIDGRPTLVAGDPKMSADVTSDTLWWSPVLGDYFPVLDAAGVWQSANFVTGPTDQVGASLSCGPVKWQAGNCYDLFGISLSPGIGIIGTGPAWPASDLTSRKLTRYNCLLVNDSPMLIDTSAAASSMIPQYRATYLGSISVSIAGQLTVHFSQGQARRCEIWSEWNQVDRVLQVVDLNTPEWVPTNGYPGGHVPTPGWVPFNNDANNCAYPFAGLPEKIDIDYRQNGFVNSMVAGPSGLIAVVLWDGVCVGHVMSVSSDAPYTANSYGGCGAKYIDPAFIGLHSATMGCAKANATASVFLGGGPSSPDSTEGNHVLFACFKG